MHNTDLTQHTKELFQEFEFSVMSRSFFEGTQIALGTDCGALQKIKGPKQFKETTAKMKLRLRKITFDAVRKLRWYYWVAKAI